MKTLQDLITEARRNLSVYRQPNTDEVKAYLDEILRILGRSQMNHDRITSIDEEDDELVVGTEYSLRCCAMTGEHRLPLSVLNATDPIAAAHEWVKEQELSELRETIRSLRSALINAQNAVDTLPAKIAQLEAQLAHLSATRGDDRDTRSDET